MPKLAGDFLGSSSLVGSGQICLLARAMVFENIRLPWHQTGTTDGVWAWWPLSLLRNQVLPEKWPTSLFDIMIPSSEISWFKLFWNKEEAIRRLGRVDRCSMEQDDGREREEEDHVWSLLLLHLLQVQFWFIYIRVKVSADISIFKVLKRNLTYKYCNFRTT